MIIECEKCKTTFNLDEGLLDENGSLVRCTICQNVFTAFPPRVMPEIEEGVAEKIEDSEVAFADEIFREEEVPDFDKTIVTDALPKFGNGDEEGIEAISFEDIAQLDSGFFKKLEENEVEVGIDEAAGETIQKEDQVQPRVEVEREVKTEEAEVSAQPQPLPKRRRSSMRITIWSIVLLIVGSAAALLVFKPELFLESFPSRKKPLSNEKAFDIGNRRLSITKDPNDLMGSFVSSEKTGKLFVVKGSITNGYPDKRSFIKIKSTILDSNGKVVKRKIVYAGNTINDKELLSLSMVEINDRLNNKFGKDEINTNISPSASIPFMIVFSDLPEDISEFTVEPLSSISAKK